MSQDGRAEDDVTMTRPRDRPLAVTIIGWIFLVIATLLIVLGVFVLLSYHVFFSSKFNQALPLAEDAPRWAKLGVVYLRYSLVSWHAATLLSVFVLVAAVQFLKLRAWARTALEVVSWLCIAGTLGSWIFLLPVWARIASEPAGAPAKGAPAFPAFNILGVATSMAYMLLSLVPAAVMIYFLRSKTVRGAFVRTG